MRDAYDQPPPLSCSMRLKRWDLNALSLTAHSMYFPCIKEFGMTSDEFADAFLAGRKSCRCAGNRFRRHAEKDSCEFPMHIHWKRLKAGTGHDMERFVREAPCRAEGSIDVWQMLNIVLYEPEIPANTGNIGQYLCGNRYPAASDRTAGISV